MKAFDFPALERFANRTSDLARLEEWWDGTDPNALALERVLGVRPDLPDLTALFEVL